MIERPAILVEREKTHGSFAETARIANKLKELIRYEIIRFGISESSKERRIVQCEALDMIAVKIARILAGDANTRDHWLDIAGYAQLGAEACQDDK